MDTGNAVTIKNLTKRYDGFVLDHISFEIPWGSIVGFIGENGAGKSTTIKAMLGLIPVNEGEIDLAGHSVCVPGGDDKWRGQVGVIFDECNFPAELKVKDIGTSMRYVFREWEQKVFEDYLCRFQIPLNKKIKELSRGMKMKLAIAVALSHHSRILILDEATSGLDPIVRNEILDIFQEFVEDGQHAVFLSSHITSDIEKIADYIILIHKGRLLLHENKDELIYGYGIVRGTKEQIERVPKELIKGRWENSFETSVLVKDKGRFERDGLEALVSSAKEPKPVLDKAGIEDILMYMVKTEV